MQMGLKLEDVNFKNLLFIEFEIINEGLGKLCDRSIKIREIIYKLLS